MTKPAILEEFDLAQQPLDVETAGPSEDWQLGHQAGLEMGQAIAQDQARQLSSELVQSLQDMSFGYSEAKAELLQQLGPLFEAISNALSPRLSKDLLVPQICDTLMGHAEQSLDTPLILAVSDMQLSAVTDALGDQPTLPFAAQADPTLNDGQAIISRGQQEAMIDLDGLLDHIRKTLGNLIPRHSEGTSHG